MYRAPRCYSLTSMTRRAFCLTHGHHDTTTPTAHAVRQLYGIVQGGVYPDLRKEAVEFVNQAPFFGIAVGGSLGADKVILRYGVLLLLYVVRLRRTAVCVRE